MHAFIDESKRGEYALCAVTVAAGDLTALRRQMNALRPPGHTRIHMTSVGKKLAPKNVSVVARLEATSRIYLMSSQKVNERQARGRGAGSGPDAGDEPGHRVVRSGP